MRYNPIENHDCQTDGAAIRYLKRKADQKQFRRDIVLVFAWPIVCLALAFSVLFIV